MRRVEEEAVRLLDETLRHQGRIAKSGTDAAPTSSFRLDGEVWSLGFAGVTCRVKDSRGMRYVAALLRHPHVERHALELVRQVLGTNDASSRVDTEPGTTHAADATDSPLDAASRRAYRERLAELRSELAKASGSRSRRGERSGQMAELKREIDFLTRQLGAGVGLGGRLRAAAPSSERARVSVTRAIKLAIAAIGARHPSLAAHLDECVRTGTYCTYAPPRDQPVEWRM
jgi:hypothetical protein